MFSKKKPYKTGWLDVGEEHKIYYELCGNPKGKPVLVVHGGPGGKIKERERQYFNPKKINAVFFDQRGCGKSKPFGSLKANTTKKLVQDMKKLLEFLEIEKTVLFGGSWGSTLSLAFAIKFPEKVAGMILRGIFLGSKKDIDYFVDGPVKDLFPEAKERFLSLVPEKQRKNCIAYYFKKMNSKNEKERKKFGFEWDYYEQSMMVMKPDSKKIMQKLKKGKRTNALFEAKYLLNNCFMENNFILKNAHKLSEIPTTIIHGSYDMVCSPLGALKLHKKIKGSELFYTFAGHSSSNKETTAKLFSEMKKMEKKAKWKKEK